MLLRRWLAIEVTVYTVLAAVKARLLDDRCQATAEHALVVLGADAVAMMLIAWAT